MATLRISLLTMLVMVAFASNSLLCRLALERTSIDAASFTSLRLLSGALVLWVLARRKSQAVFGAGNWISGLSLFAYAAGFSFAYLSLPAGTGALLLFGAVQATMIGYGLWCGERLHRWQTLGLVLALGGLVGLLLPGITAPSPTGAVAMLIAGLAWGVYSLRGQGQGDPGQETAGNFLRALVFTGLLSLLRLPHTVLDGKGVVYALISGGVASGLFYVLWYQVLKRLRATRAATVQLSVPVIAAFGGILFLDETLTLRLVLTSIAILGGIMLIICTHRKARPD